MGNIHAAENISNTASYRILGKNVKISEDSRVTGLNNNTLVTGISGCGKTGSYVTPNLFSTRGSIVVVDTKGLLYRQNAAALKRRGYKVILLDFVHPERSAPFNPLDTIKCYKKKCVRVICPAIWDDDGELLLEEELGEVEVEKYRQQDLQRIAAMLQPVNKCEKDHFWPEAAQIVISSLMAYVLEVMPKKDRHFGTVAELFRRMCNEIPRKGFSDVSFFRKLEDEDPDSFAVKRYRMYSPTFQTERTWASITQFVNNALQIFDYEESREMFCRQGIDLAECGRVKTALFVNVSDTDRSMDSIVNIFYTQLFQMLCNEADANHDGRLKVPVHIILDDFAANVQIPDFDKIISVIRSREISVSIMLQSISQLKGLYDEGQASTIINNCDNMVYMGGQDIETARFFADKAGKLPESILQLDLDHEWLFTRGRSAQLLEKIPPYSFCADEHDMEKNMRFKVKGS